MIDNILVDIETLRYICLVVGWSIVTLKSNCGTQDPRARCSPAMTYIRPARPFLDDVDSEGAFENLDVSCLVSTFFAFRSL